MARIGILGGTFDPIHNGHLMIAHQAYQEYELDSIWLMPSGIPPHKKDHMVTNRKDRCEMVRLAISDVPFFELSEFEVNRNGNTYTAETLQLLSQEYPHHQFFFIIGADSLFQIERWYHPEIIMSQTILLVAGREYPQAPCSMEEQILSLKKRYHAEIYRLHGSEVAISSAMLRSRITSGQSVLDYIPASVHAYIHNHNLYRSDNEC